jgi:hypothetical protein
LGGLYIEGVGVRVRQAWRMEASMNLLISRAACLSLCVGLASVSGQAQVIGEDFECAYRFVDLGTPPGVPSALGGLVFKAGDPDTLLIGGGANQPGAKVYAVPVVRDGDDRIVGFGAASTVHADAPNIDGALFYGPGGVLFFSRYSMNQCGQIKPGSTGMDKSVDLSGLGFSGSVGAMTLVPPGFQGAGRLKVLPYNSSIWHDATISADGAGTFDISAPTNSITLGGGPEGIVYVEDGATLFGAESVLISEYSTGRVTAYETDANGDPIPSTQRVFMTGLGGAEGGTRDPVTGDFLFSTFGGGDRVLVVRGFNPDCTANYNRDCLVDILDFLDFFDDFAACEAGPGPCGEVGNADFNGDTFVDILDFLDFFDAFGQGC